MARKKSRRAARQDRIGLALLGVVLLVATTAAVGYWQISRNRVSLDQETLCPTTGPRGATVVLLDRTDSLSPIQAASVRNRLESLREDIEKYTLFAVYTVDVVGEHLLRPVIARCNPGSGEDLSHLVANPTRVQRRWQETFAEPIAQAIGDLLKHNPAATSPIMESVQAIGIDPLRRHELKGAPRKLIIVSDMLQHTAAVSHYRGVPDYDRVGESEPYSRLRSDLSGVAVEIWYIRRANARRIQGRQHIEFWQKYIRASGGRLERVLSIEG